MTDFSKFAIGGFYVCNFVATCHWVCTEWSKMADLILALIIVLYSKTSKINYLFTIHSPTVNLHVIPGRGWIKPAGLGTTTQAPVRDN